MPYIGRTLGQGTRSRFLYTATAGQTTFSGSDSQSNTLSYADNNGVDCFQNGVLLKGGGADYTATTGTSVVLTTGASVNDVIEILVYDVFAIADHVKKSGDAMTGALTNIDVNGTELVLDADGDTSITADTDDQIDFKTGGSDRVTIDSSGNLLVGKTSSSLSTAGAELRSGGAITGTVNGGVVSALNRLTSDGNILTFNKDGSTIGHIGILGDRVFLAVSGHGVCLDASGNSFLPTTDSGGNQDNFVDIGASSARFDDIFATNGTIQTSDQNEKQDIASATAKELNVAKKLSTLFKTFRWKDKVTEKGDKARTHTGIIAQEVQTAFKAEGLDASNYGLFTSDTWTDEEGKEQTRLGVRYPELFSFIFSSIEARLTALEGK